MKKQSERMAFSGMMTALAVVVMLMGGVIPLATFVSPAVAGILLIPVMVETGKRFALGAYGAIALLSLILGSDKESALLFAALGYYPVLKVKLDSIRRAGLRLAAKLAVFNLAVAVVLLTATLILNMEALAAEYAAMSGIMLAAFAILANLTMLLYDRALVVMLVAYVKKLRPRLKIR
ncbi:MAG: hypothetical protein U0L09_02460 [Christensenellales bacterium]|nr:hypothetical protein [Christensenellales bacterium]